MTDSILYLMTATAAIAAALAFTPLAIRLARRLGVVDQPGARKVHRNPTPRMGGIAIAAAAVLVSIAGLLAGGGLGRLGMASACQVATVLAAGVGILLVGLIDDLYDISSKFKLLTLLGAGAALCASGARIETIAIHGHTLLRLGLASWPVTMLWIASVTVSMNFIDGLDGLAAGIAAITCAMLAAGAASLGLFPVAILSLAMLGSLCGFLFFNFNPARVFMGDCGSMFIGFMLAACAVLFSSHAGTTAGVLLTALALGVPFIDTLLTFVRRGVLQRRSIFSAERGHIHHRLLDLGLSQKHAVLLLYAATFAAAVAGLVALHANRVTGAAATVVALVCIAILFRTAGSTRVSETVAAVRRNRAIGRESRRYQQAFEEMQTRFRQAADFTGWWREVCVAGEVMDFTRISLSLVNRDGTPRPLRWSRPDNKFAASPTLKVSLPVRHRRGDEPLVTEIEAAADTFLESAGQRVALFSRLMGENSLADLPEPVRPTPTAKSSKTSASQLQEPEEERPEPVADQHRVAVVHDFLYTYAGAERVVEQILKIYPQADVFALFDFLPEGKRGFIRNKPVTTTFLQKMPFIRSRHRMYLPLMPLAIEQLDVSNYDIVISSSYVAAKGVITRPNQLHICYCHTPVRFAWDLQNQYLGQSGLLNGVRSLLARSVLHYIRNWDVRSANGVDIFVTNSRFVGQRVEKTYRRRSTTIHPPVDTEQFDLHDAKGDFYVTASRMVPYKRIDLIVEAFTKMPDRQLIVIGEGPDFDKIKAKAGPNVRLLGYQPFDRLRHYMRLARGFVFAAEEDFGIAPVEAQACGTPVIAFGRGGSTETVVPGRTGVFFMEQTVESLMQAVTEFEAITWDSWAIRKHAERFSARRFREQFRRLVDIEWVNFQCRQRLEEPAIEIGDESDEFVRGAAPSGVAVVAASPESREEIAEQLVTG